MDNDKKTGFAFDGISITGYIDVSRKGDMDQAKDLGIPVDTVQKERRRVSFPLEGIGAYYESRTDDGEPLTVVWCGGNDWHLYGSFEDFKTMINAAWLAREVQGKGPQITIPG